MIYRDVLAFNTNLAKEKFISYKTILFHTQASAIKAYIYLILCTDFMVRYRMCLFLVYSFTYPLDLWTNPVAYTPGGVIMDPALKNG